MYGRGCLPHVGDCPAPCTASECLKHCDSTIDIVVDLIIIIIIMQNYDLADYVNYTEAGATMLTYHVVLRPRYLATDPSSAFSMRSGDADGDFGQDNVKAATIHDSLAVLLHYAEQHNRATSGRACMTSSRDLLLVLRNIVSAR